MNHLDLKQLIGFGVAGNFAHHLEQANEAGDFIHVEVEEENAPKGIFPFYLPQQDHFLGTFPLSSEAIVHPRTDNGNLQIEPELAIICDLSYNAGQIIDITPKFFTAFNDCSIRREGAKKISQKKNWGEQTKGISADRVAIDKFDQGGVLDTYHIASFLKRNGEVHAYGEDSAVITYNYFYGKLKNWMIGKLNHQKDSGPLEDLNLHIKNSHYPEQAVFAVGATSYTEFGESTFLEVGDDIFVYIYNSRVNNYQQLLEHMKTDDRSVLIDCAILHQKVI